MSAPRWASLPQRTVRFRLTALYGGLFLLSGAVLLAITYVLVRHATAGNLCYDGPGGLGVCASGTPQNGSPLPDSSDPSGQGMDIDRAQQLATQQHAHELHQLLIQSGVALAIMAASSLVLGWFVAGRVLAPLRTITDATRAISATNLHQRLALTGPDDELRELGDTIDRLLGRLEGAFEAQRRFVANASHELRTPLTVVRALLQAALTDPDATVATFRATCRDVLAEGERQERLIEALLVLARSERGLERQEPFDLGTVAEQVLQVRRPTAEHHGLTVRAECCAAPAHGDARLAERLAANLVDNAVRHNSTGGELDVRTGSTAGRAFLTVTNTGPYVPPDQVGRLLQPFQRLGADATDQSGGLGLGLSIVHAIATAHAATITATPRPAGGLTLTVTFPPPAP